VRNGAARMRYKALGWINAHEGMWCSSLQDYLAQSARTATNVEPPSTDRYTKPIDEVAGNETAPPPDVGFIGITAGPHILQLRCHGKIHSRFCNMACRSNTPSINTTTLPHLYVSCRLANVAMNLTAELAGDEFGHAMLLEAKLRRCVQVLPLGGHFAVKQIDEMWDLHDGRLYGIEATLGELRK